ncbi:hypothetical protein SLA2020_351810 [Shorea laevis]
MSLLSWNCRGLGNSRTVRNLCQMVEDKRPTILFLMETNSREIEYPIYAGSWDLIVCLWWTVWGVVVVWRFSGRQQ